MRVCTSLYLSYYIFLVLASFLLMGSLISCTVSGGLISGDITPPTIDNVSVEAGTTVTPDTSNLVVTFSEAINESTVTDATLTVINTATNMTVSGSWTPNDDKTQFTFNGILESAASYQVINTASITDTAGNALPSGTINISFNTTCDWNDNFSSPSTLNANNSSEHPQCWEMEPSPYHGIELPELWTIASGTLNFSAPNRRIASTLSGGSGFAPLSKKVTTETLITTVKISGHTNFTNDGVGGVDGFNLLLLDDDAVIDDNTTGYGIGFVRVQGGGSYTFCYVTMLPSGILALSTLAPGNGCDVAEDESLWLRIQRTNDTFTSSHSLDGINFTTLHTGTQDGSSNPISNSLGNGSFKVSFSPNTADAVAKNRGVTMTVDEFTLSFD